MQRECRRLVSRPLYLFCMVIAPLFCYIFFTTLMDSGLPKDLPAGVVDMDDSSTSRNIVRNLDAFSQTGVVAHYSNVTVIALKSVLFPTLGSPTIPNFIFSSSYSRAARRSPLLSFFEICFRALLPSFPQEESTHSTSAVRRSFLFRFRTISAARQMTKAVRLTNCAVLNGNIKKFPI